MTGEEALLTRRTVRVFSQEPISQEKLTFLMEAARNTSCAANLQRLRYIVVREKSLVLQVLSHTKWAGLVAPRRDPQPGVTSPTAFVVLLAPVKAPDIVICDAGMALQSIQIAAQLVGLGSCCLGAIDRDAIAALLGIPSDMRIMYLEALGVPAETPIAYEVTDSTQVAYSLDEDDRLHVPKLALSTLVDWR